MSVLDIYCEYGIKCRVYGSDEVSEWYLLAHLKNIQLEIKQWEA